MSSTLTYLVGASIVVVLASCLLFLRSDYRAGIFGRLGILMIAVSAFAYLVRLGELDLTGAGHRIHFTTPAVLLWLGLALFLGRQAVRFVYRTRRAAREAIEDPYEKVRAG